MFVREKCVFYFSKKVRLFSQNDVLFLFYFLINPAGTTVNVHFSSSLKLAQLIKNIFHLLQLEMKRPIHRDRVAAQHQDATESDTSRAQSTLVITGKAIHYLLGAFVELPCWLLLAFYPQMFGSWWGPLNDHYINAD